MYLKLNIGGRLKFIFATALLLMLSGALVAEYAILSSQSDDELEEKATLGKESEEGEESENSPEASKFEESDNSKTNKSTPYKRALCSNIGYSDKFQSFFYTHAYYPHLNSYILPQLEQTPVCILSTALCLLYHRLQFYEG